MSHEPLEVTLKSIHFAVLCCVVLMVQFASVDHAHAKRVRGSTGIGVGSSTANYGLSLKHFTNKSSSIQAVIGSGWGGALGLNVDGLIEMPSLVDAGALEIAWAAGGGLGAWFWNGGSRYDYWGRYHSSGGGFSLNASFVAALEFNFHILPNLPFDLVLEWRPHVGVLPSFYFAAYSFAGHVRLYLF